MTVGDSVDVQYKIVGHIQLASEKTYASWCSLSGLNRLFLEDERPEWFKMKVEESLKSAKLGIENLENILKLLEENG